MVPRHAPILYKRVQGPQFSSLGQYEEGEDCFVKTERIGSTAEKGLQQNKKTHIFIRFRFRETYGTLKGSLQGPFPKQETPWFRDPSTQVGLSWLCEELLRVSALLGLRVEGLVGFLFGGLGPSGWLSALVLELVFTGVGALFRPFSPMRPIHLKTLGMDRSHWRECARARHSRPTNMSARCGRSARASHPVPACKLRTMNLIWRVWERT